ncbi:hypothetical protein CBR_g18738 [Chara braunii]|uniref:DUS-like FMN-binding domain-containing protein n=1 Tax=Chara braunii TaxID=69332 RepID=A0A388KWA7_CHABU|nr:hypothetical protein CBR_g18738 [Chara braunii]|eukprot:GBG74327.1 hypothetical protein CBR_g18738 [Chara braunii]
MGPGLTYKDKKILAPMVRVGTLPMRLLAAEYGADITYAEEIVDHKMLGTARMENDILGTVDFVEKSTGEVVFRTCPAETPHVVFQMGTADPVRALRTAELVCRDVAAVDVNMGCPKQFSISGGMGAALLSKPELVRDILSTLKRNLDLPVTCKIRLLDTYEKTVELARAVERTGVAAVAVHGRRVRDRPRDPAQWDGIAAVASALSIPVIANGDVFEYADFERIKEATGAAAVMVARAAAWNVSIFRPEGPLPIELIKQEYVRKCASTANDVKSTKHTLKEMIMHHSCLEFPEGKALNACRSLQDICKLYKVGELYESDGFWRWNSSSRSSNTSSRRRREENQDQNRDHDQNHDQNRDQDQDQNQDQNQDQSRYQDQNRGVQERVDSELGNEQKSNDGWTPPNQSGADGKQPRADPNWDMLGETFWSSLQLNEAWR